MKVIGVAFAAMLSLAAEAVADDGKVRDALHRQDLAPEAGVRMLALLEAATGHEDYATCINDWYFGAPLSTRIVVNEMWRHPELTLDAATILSFIELCRDYPTTAGSNEDLWKVADTAEIAIAEPGDGAIIAGAAIRIIWRHANIAKEEQATACILEKYQTNELVKTITDKIRSGAGPTMTAITYDAVRWACSYPKNTPFGKDVQVPPVIDIMGAARERILAVRDLDACEAETDATARTKCLDGAYDARKTALLEGVRAPEKELKAKLAEMDRQTWHLPDGRMIFEDNDHWQFEDGSFVPPDLVATRVPRPYANAHDLQPMSAELLKGFMDGALQMAGWHFRATGRIAKGACILQGGFNEKYLFADIDAGIRDNYPARAVGVIDVMLERHCGYATKKTVDPGDPAYSAGAFLGWSEAYQSGFYSAAVEMAAHLREDEDADATRNCVLDRFWTASKERYPAFLSAARTRSSQRVVAVLYDQTLAECRIGSTEQMAAIAPEQQSADPNSLAGTYSQFGIMPNGEKYEGGTYVVERLADGRYQFNYSDDRDTATGTGTLKDGRIKVTFKYNIMDYKVNPDGSLTANWGQDGKGVETLVRQ